MTYRIPMIRLDAQYLGLKQDIDAAISRVLNRGIHVLGPEVEAFEREWAAYCGARHCVAVGSGTAAIEIALKAAGVGVGRYVLTSPLSAYGTIAGIVASGGCPIFRDVNDDSGTLKASTTCDENDIKQVRIGNIDAVVPVHLYGEVHTCLVEPYEWSGGKNWVPVIEDACQAHGATSGGHRPGELSLAACHSFYPTKNLGCFGDGGAITTNDEEFAAKCRKLRNYGEGAGRYVSDTDGGTNSRLDEIQAAVLRVKLPYLDGWNAARTLRASIYHEIIGDGPKRLTLTLPYVCTGKNWHQYVVRTKERDALKEYLADRGIQTQIHYPLPLHRHPAHQYGVAGDFPIAERISNEVLSLPIAPEITVDEVAEVARIVMEWCNG